jgi:signal transduction histidine kinase/ActR/RegA family two-component response regulator
MNNFASSDLGFVRHLVEAAPYAAVLCVWMLAALFFYLKRYCRKDYFSLWSLAWCCYGVSLSLDLVVSVFKPSEFLFALQLWCLATAAVFLVWGSLRSMEVVVPPALPTLFIVFVLVWAYAGGYLFRRVTAVQLPVYLMFTVASLSIASAFYWLRPPRTFLGTVLLAAGLLLGAVHVATQVWARQHAELHMARLFTSIGWQLYVAVGMVLLLLEESRDKQAGLVQGQSELLKEVEALRALKQSQQQQSLMVAAAPPSPAPLKEPEDPGRNWKKAYEELRAKQATLCGQERLQAMGRMAGVIAHDLSNLLSPVVAFSEFLLRQQPAPDEVQRRTLTRILEAGEAISSVIERMREFYRRRAHGPLGAVNLNQLVERVVAQARPLWYEKPLTQGIRVEVETKFQEQLPAFPAHENEIQEALLSLLSNSLDAMPRGGRITITTRLAGPPTEDRPGEPSQVVLEVRDTGTGMEDYTLEHCLEPFFTTKGNRGGKGLGLAMVYGMMERHKGWIEIETEQAKGTTIRLIFPRRKMVDLQTGTSPVTGAVERRVRVLCVDDEPVLGDLLKHMLESRGHAVAFVNDGLTAVKTFREALQEGCPFDAVITDLNMPQMDGRQVTRMIKSVSPHTPVILLTGYGTICGSEEENSPTPVDGILGKPPRIDQLTRLLTQVTQRRSLEALTPADVPGKN